MASSTPRKNKAGEIISYQIKVSRGRDKLTGKQLTPFTTTYTPPEGWSKKAIERDLLKVMGEFESACNRGEVLTREQIKEEVAAKYEQEKQRQAEERRKPTFNQYIEIFLREKSANLSPVSLHNYVRELKKAAVTFGETKMQDIDFLTVKWYFTDLQANGKNKYTGKPLSTSSILQHYAIIKSFFENAVENEVVEINPMQKMKRPKLRKDEMPKEPLVFTENEVKYIIECLNNEPLKWKAVVILAIDSGCRAGELMGLKWSDIDFKTGKVNICRSVQYTKEKGVYTSTPKNRKSRVININVSVLAVLREWKKEQSLFLFRMGIPQNEHCFTGDNGELLPPARFNQYLRGFGKRYNLPGIHPHALRHTMATLSITNGADIVSVSTKLGHSNPSITLDVYAHANEEAQLRASKILAEAIYQKEA